MSNSQVGPAQQGKAATELAGGTRRSLPWGRRRDPAGMRLCCFTRKVGVAENSSPGSWGPAPPGITPRQDILTPLRSSRGLKADVTPAIPSPAKRDSSTPVLCACRGSPWPGLHVFPVPAENTVPADDGKKTRTSSIKLPGASLQQTGAPASPENGNSGCRDKRGRWRGRGGGQGKGSSAKRRSTHTRGLQEKPTTSSCFSACCHQTHWKEKNLPSTTQTCAGSWMCLVRTS